MVVVLCVVIIFILLYFFFLPPTNTNMPVRSKGTHACGCNLFAIFEINKRSVLMLRHT